MTSRNEKSKNYSTRVLSEHTSEDVDSRLGRLRLLTVDKWQVLDEIKQVLLHRQLDVLVKRGVSGVGSVRVSVVVDTHVIA
jgi:hypothetical protein